MAGGGSWKAEIRKAPEPQAGSTIRMARSLVS